MNDLEAALSALLVDRAERVEPRRGHREATLRHARRRRVVNAAMAGAASVAVVVGGFGIAQRTDSTPEVPQPAPAAPATLGQTTVTTGEYGFRSKAGPEYPWVATGSFREREWELRAAMIRLHDSMTRVTFRVHGRGVYLGGAGASTGFDRVADGLYAEHFDLDWVFDNQVAALFGAATPEAHTVDIEPAGGEPAIEAHVFERYDARTGFKADYWAAFVPADVTGRIVVRDASGRELASEVIPPPL